MYTRQQQQSQQQMMSQKQMFHLSNIFERLLVSLNKVVHIQSQGNPNVDLSQFSLFSEGQLRTCIDLENTFLDISTIIKSLGFSRGEISEQKSIEMLYCCAERYLCLKIFDKSNLQTLLNQVLAKISSVKNQQQQENFPGQQFIAYCLEMLCYALINDKKVVNQLDCQIKVKFFNYDQTQTIKNPLDNEMMFNINNNMFKNDKQFENEKDDQLKQKQRLPNIPQDFYGTYDGKKTQHQNQAQPNYGQSQQYLGNSMNTNKR